jgi:hypothetical protein
MEVYPQSTIASFAAITRRVIARDGFESYLPTVLYPDRRYLMVLEGVPSDGDLEAISLSWAQTNAIANEEFLLAFKISPTQFKIIRRIGSSFETEIFIV